MCDVLESNIIIKETKNYRFGSRQHSAIDLVYLITDLTERTLEEKYLCTALFLDVAHSFDMV